MKLCTSKYVTKSLITISFHYYLVLELLERLKPHLPSVYLLGK